MAYTPGLKRKEIALVRETRRLPIKGEVLVKINDIVSSETVVARTNLPGEPYIVDVAEKIGIDPSVNKVSDYMIKKLGDPVEEKEVIAKISLLMGIFKKEALSPVEGFIEHIGERTGQVVIRSPDVPLEMKAYIPGAIHEILPNEGVVVETYAAFIQGIFGVGGETTGEIMIKPEEILEAKSIEADCAGKILIVRGIATLDALLKAVKVGAKGIVTGGMDIDAINSFVGYTIGVAITGMEETGLTVMVTEGFGKKMKMAWKTFNLLKECEGLQASMNGSTQIRAGVIRPEIIIPREELDPLKMKELSIEDTKVLSEGLQVGTPIRIIREPYFGELARVVSLPPELNIIDSKSNVRILVAELEDGRKVTVPRANVEIVSE